MKIGKFFSLIEISIVIALMSIIYITISPNAGTTIIKAKETVLKKDLRVLRECIDQYKGDFGKYPESLDILVEKKYIKDIPIDPFTNKKDSWITIPYEPEEGEPIPEEDLIYDVKSGYEANALDGSSYSEW